jgi:cell wall-associated NlpC family hydrolase
MEGAVRQLWGEKYRLGGSGRGGVDCSGLVMRVYQSVGVKLPHNARAQFALGSSVGLGGLQYGDVLFFNTKPLATRPMTCLMSSVCTLWDVPGMYGVTHNGMYVGGGRFVHASTSQGVTQATVDDPYWRARLIGIRRYVEEDLGG